MRLADQQSPCCGTPLEGMTMGQGSKTKGKKYESCKLCGRRRLGQKHAPRPWKEKHSPPDRRDRIYEPGLPVCWLHEIIPSDKPDDWPTKTLEMSDEEWAPIKAEYEEWLAECRKRPPAPTEAEA